jgi:hypothetical protein
MSDCACSRRREKSGRRAAHSRNHIIFWVMYPGWVLSAPSGSSAREIYIQKSISPSRQHCARYVVEFARDACLLCTRGRAHTQTPSMAYIHISESAAPIYIWKRRQRAGCARCLRQRLSFLVLIVRVVFAWCFVCCNRAYLVQGENIRVYARSR